MVYHWHMKIGELSKKANVPIDTVRYYEKRGLIPVPTRTVSGYRQYQPQDIARLTFIVQAKSLGFTLDEIGQLLTLRQDGRACTEIRNVAEAKAQDIEIKIQKLSCMRQTLLELAKQCGKTSDDDPCPILKSLETDIHE